MTIADQIRAWLPDLGLRVHGMVVEGLKCRKVDRAVLLDLPVWREGVEVCHCATELSQIPGDVSGFAQMYLEPMASTLVNLIESRPGKTISRVPLSHVAEKNPGLVLLELTNNQAAIAIGIAEGTRGYPIFCVYIAFDDVLQVKEDGSRATDAEAPTPDTREFDADYYGDHQYDECEMA